MFQSCHSSLYTNLHPSIDVLKIPPVKKLAQNCRILAATHYLALLLALQDLFDMAPSEC